MRTLSLYERARLRLWIIGCSLGFLAFLSFTLAVSLVLVRSELKETKARLVAIEAEKHSWSNMQR